MNLGLPEMIFILLVALLVFGPRKLPELGRQLGRAMTEFRRASNEFKWQLEEEMRQLEETERPAKPPRQSVPAEEERSIAAPPEGTISSSHGISGEAAGDAHLATNGSSIPATDVSRPKGTDA